MIAVRRDPFVALQDAVRTGRGFRTHWAPAPHFQPAAAGSTNSTNASVARGHRPYSFRKKRVSIPALEKRIAEYQALYGDLRSVTWVMYSDLAMATHKDGADEAILELLRDADVLQGIIAAIKRRSDVEENDVPRADVDIGWRTAGARSETAN